jgi:hypothetical protein
MIELQKVQDLMEKINSLQERIASCKDDRQAITLQSELVDILKETFEDEQLLTTILLAGKMAEDKK